MQTHINPGERAVLLPENAEESDLLAEVRRSLEADGSLVGWWTFDAADYEGLEADADEAALVLTDRSDCAGCGCGAESIDAVHAAIIILAGIGLGALLVDVLGL